MDSYEGRMIDATGDGGVFPPRLPMGESFTVKRVDLLRELTKQCRAAGMAVLVAPEGFGKTALLIQYAEEVRSDPLRGVARIMDAKGKSPAELATELAACRLELPQATRPLIAIDDVPPWGEAQAKEVVRVLRAMRSENFEVLLACTPRCRELIALLGDAAKFGSQALRIRPREYASWIRTFSISGDLDVYGLTQGIPMLVAALSVVTQGEGAASTLDACVDSLYRSVWSELEKDAPEALRAAGMMLLMGKGGLGEFDVCGIKLSQAARVRLVHDYPLFGVDPSSHSFSCLGTWDSRRGMRKVVSECMGELPAKAVRALLRRGSAEDAVLLADELLGAAAALEEMGRFPTACALAGQGAYVARIATETTMAAPEALLPVGCQLARYTASLTLGDFKVARAMATELAARALEVEEEVTPSEWAVACALRGIWSTCPGIGLPEVSPRKSGRSTSDAARALRSFSTSLRNLLEGKTNRQKSGEMRASRDSREGPLRDLPSIFAMCAELVREVSLGHDIGIDERDDMLLQALDYLRERRLAPVLMTVRLVISMRRVYAGLPVTDERAFVDAGTIAIRTSDQPLQLLCLLLEGWQYLSMDQVVNAHFRAQQVIKLADRRVPFVREHALVLEKIAYICNTSRVALSEEAELIDLSPASCRPSAAWTTALSLAAVRFDAELSAWMSLHRKEMLDEGIRPAARLALRALGVPAAAIVRLIPEHLQAAFKTGASAEERSERLFEVVGDMERTVVGQLTVRLFGGLKIERNGHVLTSALWRRRKTSVVAARLALAPGAFVPRATLQQELWHGYDYTHARNSLYSTLSALRRALGQTKDGPQYLILQGEGIAFNAEYVVSDVMRFDMLAREVLLKRKGISAPQIIDICLKVEQLYAGPLFVPDGEGGAFFEKMREGYRTKFVDCMLRGVEAALEERDVSSASWMADAALLQAPLREDVVRAAMRVYELAGRRREVVDLYRRHALALKAQDKGMPEPETRALYDRIVDASGTGSSVRADYGR